MFIILSVIISALYVQVGSFDQYSLVYSITIKEINELNAAFSGARLDSLKLQNYAKYIIQQNSTNKSEVNSITFENFSELSELLKNYSTRDGAVQVQHLLDEVMSQIKSMIEILKSQGISDQKILAVAFPVAYNDLVHMLSLNAHKLSLKINVIPLRKPESPKFKVAKPHKTTRKTYKKAVKKAFKEAKRLKVLAPRIMRNMPLQTSIISDFQKIVTNLADSVEKAFASYPAYATGAKEIILNITNQSEKVLKILEGNVVLLLYFCSRSSVYVLFFTRQVQINFEIMIKYYILLLCLYQGVMVAVSSNPGIDSGDIAELNYIFRETHYDSDLLEIYASYLISRHGIDDGLINSSAVQIYTDLYEILTQSSSGNNTGQAQKLMQNIFNQTKIMFRIIKQQGIQEASVLALWLPWAYNDMINVLSPKFRNMIAKKPNITARVEFITALSKARSDVYRFNFILPKLINGINQQQTLDFNKLKQFMTKLGNSTYSIAAVSKASYANGIKALIEDASKQVETIFEVFANNGVKEGPIIFEILIKIFMDMMTQLVYFLTAI
ncbi:unnamed protein product [Chironomus riparius]|uniref:Uncharacterized protein n=1 Tax=Chironomus riparius TaxID=315576 RepID=A0A9N9S2H8_9DIPT|nr:unnamed protein product [Chironomus riparius]